MGRREKPLEPTAGPVQLLAHELRKLRVTAGSPTYRVMAERVPYSAPTLSAAAAGERLPTLPVLLAYVAACDGDPREWERRWYRTVAETAEQVTDGGDSPYPGLTRFGTGDEERFHGRDDLVAELVRLTARRRVAALTGASGSGKSSLLRAGLIPALRRSSGPARPAAIRVLTPGAHPARTHRDLFAAADGDGDTLLVVDQFEEVFSVCRDPAERSTFVGRLLTACDADSRLRVLIAVRGDFYGRCAEVGALADALRDATLLVGPMSPACLREAVVRPAAAERLVVERALTARIVADVADEPGGLPLMAHALREVWRRRNGRTLTETAYDAIGGVRGAVAHTAEDVYKGFDGAEAATARSLFLRLVAPGDGTQDTRRPVDRSELPPGCAPVLERLVAARLLTVEGRQVEMAHEALLAAWPRLRGWVETDRERLRLHRALTEAAHGWVELARDPGALYRGARLKQAREAFGRREAASEVEVVPEAGVDAEAEVAEPPAVDLTPLEREFLDAAVDAQEQRLRARRRSVRGARMLLSVVAVVLCLAAVAGAVAWEENRAGRRQRDEAEARRIVGGASTLRTSDPVLSMRLGVAAWRIADLPETREAVRAAAAQREQNALSAADGGDVPNAPRVLSADGRLLTSVAGDRVTRWDVRRGRRTVVQEVPDAYERFLDISDDGRLLATRGEHGIVVRDLGQGGGRPLGEPFGAAAKGGVHGRFGPGGHTLVLRRDVHGGFLDQVWDTRRHRLLHEDGDVAGELPYPQVSPDSRSLARCTGGGKELVVEEMGGARRRAVHWPEGAVRQACAGAELRFTPDSEALVVATEKGIRTWELASGRERPRIDLPRAAGAETAFNEDGTVLAVLSAGKITLWDTAAPAAPLLTHPVDSNDATDVRVDTVDGVVRYQAGRTVHTLGIRDVLRGGRLRRPLGAAQFGPDGHTLAATQRHGGVWRFQVRDVEDESGVRGESEAEVPVTWLPGEACGDCAVNGMTFTRDGRAIAYGAPGERGTTVRKWDLARRGAAGRASTVPVSVGSMAFAGADTPVLVSGLSTAGHDNDNWRAEVWALDGRGKRTRALHRATAGPGGTLTPDGRTLLTWDGVLVDVRTGRPSSVLPRQNEVTAAAFSPDGRLLAVADANGRVALWEVRRTRPLGVLAPGARTEGDDRPVSVLAFSADGRHVAAGGSDGTVRVWETETPRLAGAEYPAWDGPVLAIGFAGDDVRVVTPYAVGRRFSVAPEQAAREVCERAGGGLGRAEWRAYLPKVEYRRTC